MIPTFVVVPVKDQLGYTQPLVDALLAEMADTGGELDQVIIYDNGSQDGTREWLKSRTADSHGRLVWFDATGEGIHSMWNLGLDRADKLTDGTPHNVAILNNDLEISVPFLAPLAEALRMDVRVGVAGANYDGRDFGNGTVQIVREICANRYDGTGGLPGFAFMLRGEHGYRFPDDLVWWYGDNDLLLTVQTDERVAVLARDARCKHLDGGGRTGEWDAPEMQAILARDRERFVARWRNR